MTTYNNILEAVGRTPLIKLNNITQEIQSTIYSKVEYLNPGGSTKDRIALAMIEAAEKAGKLQPGGTIIEATAGNTGVGLALIAAIKKYRCIFVMPDKMSQDKINLLKAYGAEVVITPTSVPPDSPESFNGVAERLAQEISGAYRPDQFANPNNPLAHYLTTGPEIWSDTNGKVDVFVAAMGTGGTISGVGKYLKEKNPNIVIVGADPEGSIFSGDTPKLYKVEGIGEDFIPKTFNRQVIDEMVRVSDQESFNMARRLAREEGLLVGGSCGTAMAAALKYAARLSEAKQIVVLLPDTGRNYINKIYSDTWMQENGFWEDISRKTIKLQDILIQKKDFPPLVYVNPQDTLSQVIAVMEQLNISQIPVIEDNHILGSLNEAALMKLLHEGINFSKQKVSEVMSKPLPILNETTDISEAYRVLLSANSAIIIEQNSIPIGLITRSDLIKYWVSQTKYVDYK
ncbi:cystathionine beta-synthase [Aetokthonos hydrillicola Thurmond2011]|jgi:cystathionine beta-synthase|uniref:Cystathionine beta-synthase n=1 Tax=Aetokthonos hydrillicola Thurmond2011 TaxID=2712845 RepID=A0AAP5MBU7_9CYAN|nr:cystathionine beta-synthase [Aetokthonos hydrillicola]MBO3458045.1 cystathionine beta-synthase [Aetokthonos hydrillicola CCALA 1050]MBW4587120.1 cystathionine beta-synthase [Aetokthonos hydrillicola CCALA 1050]MDR9899630.1 cystathionine beta-synthase [Aetokthonos hydrillicola Thurmond2011]